MPKTNACVKTKSVLFNRLQSILLSVLRRVYLSLVNNGQWRKKWVVDLIPWPQLGKGFKDSWKLCLNLCSLKRLKPRRSRVISLIPLGLWQVYTELAAGLKNWRIFFLNVRKLLELQKLGSSLFHSEIVDGEKEFLNKLCFDLKMGRLWTFLVAYGAPLTGIKWKRYPGCWFLYIYKKDKAFCTNVEA